jgi:hypothetical protein
MPERYGRKGATAELWTARHGHAARLIRRRGRRGGCAAFDRGPVSMVMVEAKRPRKEHPTLVGSCAAHSVSNRLHLSPRHSKTSGSYVSILRHDIVAGVEGSAMGLQDWMEECGLGSPR